MSENWTQFEDEDVIQMDITEPKRLQSGAAVRGCQGEVNWCRADNMSVTPIPHVTDTHDSHDGAQLRL